MRFRLGDRVRSGRHVYTLVRRFVIKGPEEHETWFWVMPNAERVVGLRVDGKKPLKACAPLSERREIRELVRTTDRRAQKRRK